MTTAKSLKYLFVSRTRAKLLNIFFYQPQELYYVRQLVRLTQEEINSVRRELQNLKKAGIVQSEVRGNRLYYWVNSQSSLFTGLLIWAHQSTGLGLEVQKDNNRLGQLKLILCSYNFLTNKKTSSDDVDLIAVGDLNLKEFDNLIKKEEAILSREINYMIMNRSELKLRQNKRDPFIINFFLNYPVVIWGDPGLLTQ